MNVSEVGSRSREHAVPALTSLVGCWLRFQVRHLFFMSSYYHLGPSIPARMLLKTEHQPTSSQVENADPQGAAANKQSSVFPHKVPHVIARCAIAPPVGYRASRINTVAYPNPDRTHESAVHILKAERAPSTCRGQSTICLRLRAQKTSTRRLNSPQTEYLKKNLHSVPLRGSFGIASP